MKILKSNGTYRFFNFTEITDYLPVGNYTLKVDINGYYLEETNSFKLPEKIYGDVEKRADRYLKSFDRGINMGILFNGEKGSGKTLLSKMVCIKSNLPIIQIDTKYKGVDFFTFINNIKQKCIILIDEFDKIYPDDIDGDDGVNPQLELLKLMDGGFDSQKLFIFTSNKLNISEYMINRPSRIRYKEEFNKLEESVVREILEDKLINKDYTEEFIELFYIFFGFNLDTLLILIDEVNFMDESPKKVIKTMNIIPESSLYSVKLIHKGKAYDSYFTTPQYPLEIQYFDTYWFEGGRSGNKNTEEFINIDQTPKQYDVTINKEGIIFTHKKDKYQLVFSKYEKSSLVF